LSLISKILIVLFFVVSVNATLVSTAFVNKDLTILEELDISSEYITDYRLQKEFVYNMKHTQKTYTKKLNNAYLFIPQIKKILRENNMPSAFLYLAMAESNFILNASSNKSAKGIWQFMKPTGRHYGLQIDDFIDERMDILKSTQAATIYLKKLHSMFGKWYLSAVAYNCGEGRVIEGITRAKIDMYCDDIGYKQCRKDPKIKQYRQIIKDYQAKRVKFRKLNKVYKIVKKWKYQPDINQLLVVQTKIKRQYLPEESREYIRKIIVLAMMNNSDFLIKDENTHLLNRGLSDPIAKIEVKGGILLKNIAELIGFSKNKLRELNQHIKKNILPLDDKIHTLYIPYSKLSRYNLNKDNLKTTQYEVYNVVKGDNLASIGKRFYLSYKLIRKFNHLKSTVLSIGQELIIPIDPDTYKRDINYIVKVGDTLNKIALSHNIEYTKIIKDNHLKSSMIKIGDKLVIRYN